MMMFFWYFRLLFEGLLKDNLSVLVEVIVHLGEADRLGL